MLFGCEDSRMAPRRPFSASFHLDPARSTLALITINMIIVLLWPSAVLALNPSLDISQYAHTAWKDGAGFGKGAIHGLAQTPDGYLWLATEFGLLRFDGVRAVPWEPPAGEHLPNSDIRSVLAGADGTLWIGTAKGLVSWKNGKLTHYPQFNAHDVHQLLQDSHGTVWAAGTMWEAGPFGTGAAIVCAFHGGGVQCYGQDGGFGPYGVTEIFEDSRRNLWFGAGNGIWRWQPGPPQHYPLPGSGSGNTGFAFPWRAFVETQSGELLIAQPSRGVDRFVRGKLEPYDFPSDEPQLHRDSLLRDRDGGLWIGTEDIGVLHVHEGRIDRFDQSNGLSSNSVQNLFEDREGTIWIATVGGLDSFRDYVVPTVSVEQGLSTPFVQSVLAARDGAIWLGTPNGLNRLKNGQVTIYRRPANARTPGTAERMEPVVGHRTVVHEVAANGLPDDEVGSLYEDAQGRIWVSTAQGLAYFENDKFVPLRGVHFPNWVHSPVARDTSGNLWIINDQGLYRLSEGRVAQYIPSESLGLHGTLQTLLLDAVRGGMWLASWQGKVVYFKDGKVRAAYGAGDGLGGGRVNDLYLDEEDALWAATEGGLSRIKDGRVWNLSSKNGLPCDAVNGLIQDDSKSFWLYMGCGLVRVQRSELEAWYLDPKRRIQTTLFDLFDGVKSRAGVQNFAPRMARGKDGKIWFVPYDGVSYVDPRHLSSNALAPPIRVEEVTANGKTYDPAIANELLRLPSQIRDLSIRYTALSFVAPEKVRFRIKLEGQDEDWRELTDRYVQYTNLAPRHYRFRVLACNNSGLWNEEGASLDFSVAPTYWQTSWFRALCAMSILALLWAAYQLRVRQLHHQFEATLDARVSERTRIARDLHDTLLQSAHGLLLRFQTVSELLPARPIDAKEKLDSAIDQTAEFITEARDEVQGLRESTVQGNDLALAVSTLGEELATGSASERPAFRVAVEGEPRDLHPILRDEIYKIAAEAMRNAFRHAQAHNVEVEIRYDDEQFRLRVRDDGKGMDPAVLSQQHGSEGHYGLPGMRERATLVGGKLTVWSEVDVGTEIELWVPSSAAYTVDQKASWLLPKFWGKG